VVSRAPRYVSAAFDVGERPDVAFFSLNRWCLGQSPYSDEFVRERILLNRRTKLFSLCTASKHSLIELAADLVQLL
jgi:hypothetical protein